MDEELKKQNKKYKSLALLLVFYLVVGGFLYYRWAENVGAFPFGNKFQNSPADFSVQTKPAASPITSADQLPSRVKISVPFTTQAPFANWDTLHEEACEEASLMMVYYFLKKTNIDSPYQAEKEIQNLVKYEEENGYKVDVTTKELNQIAKEYYGLAGAVISDITVDDIKKELAAGRPVIVPAAGKLLPNPNFRNGGPNYHMLVVIGYDESGFITNDPGTRKGQDFRYSYDDLFNAIHDYDPKDILLGTKNILVFS